LSEDPHWNPGNMIYGDNPLKWNENAAEDPLGLNRYTYFVDINAVLQSGNLYVYCVNNPVSHKDTDGEALETIIDVISLGSSVIAVIHNPKDGWAWASLVGDAVDLIPFVTGVGEATKGVSLAFKAADAVDDLYDTGKAVDKASDIVDGICFVEGTLVYTDEGHEAIETIETGDYVWAWDENTNTTALKRVVETYINETEELVHVFVNGEEIVTTPTHPFYSPEVGWTEAGELSTGDTLLLFNGEFAVVDTVCYESLDTPQEVYNFQVENYHTYYVSKNYILVHNSCSVTSKIQENSSLIKEANKLSGALQREADSLVQEFLKGNVNPGLGTKHLAGDIYYLRGKNGARVFYRNVNGTIDILGKSSKANEQTVINLVLKNFR